jgi:hypothetical protein
MTDQRSHDPRDVVFLSLVGRVAIITGAGQGLGRAFAKAFAAIGAVAIIAERNGERGEAVAAEIAAAGGKTRAITTDAAGPFLCCRAVLPEQPGDELQPFIHRVTLLPGHFALPAKGPIV